MMELDNMQNLPWLLNHPGWGSFVDHTLTKWKNRFVVSALNGEQSQIISFLNETTGLHYSCIEFTEKDLFPDEDDTYQIMCAYFFPTEERDFCAKLIPSEVNEVYWY